MIIHHPLVKNKGKWGLALDEDGRVVASKTTPIPSGLKNGDKITHINKISVRNKESILNILYSKKFLWKTTLQLTLLRENPTKSNKDILSDHRIQWPSSSHAVNAKREYRKRQIRNPVLSKQNEIDESKLSSSSSPPSSSSSPSPPISTRSKHTLSQNKHKPNHNIHRPGIRRRFTFPRTLKWLFGMKNKTKKKSKKGPEKDKKESKKAHTKHHKKKKYHRKKTIKRR